MRIVLLIGIAISAMLIAVVGNTNDTSLIPFDGARDTAKRIWELAVKAQGGRERLHRIDSIVVMGSKVPEWPEQNPTIKSATLYVFPDRYWSMVDEQPSSIFGLSMQMKNWSTRKAYYSNADEKREVILKSMSSNDKSNDLAGIIGELLETRWNQPVVESWTSGKIGNLPVDIVQTTLRGNRIEFAFDRSTHLPVQVSAFSKSGSSSKTSMSDFKEFSGIMLPTTVVIHSVDGTIKYKNGYEINAVYNERIFQEPPSFQKGFSAWKKESANM